MANRSKSIFLLGAGFTKAVYPVAPLNNELLKAIIDNGGNTLSKYYGSYKVDDIEKLLTQLDLESISNSEVRKDRLIINSEISYFFSQYRFTNYVGEVPTWLYTFANTVLKEDDSIICLNYDCFLEGALDYFKIWSPNGGYARVSNPLVDSNPNPKNIIIYKIHGSENFVESKVDFGKRSQTSIGFSANGFIYPISCEHSHFGGGAHDPSPYIIAPSFVKIPHVDISAMMLDILDIVKTATNLIIIGCGMRPEDNFLWLLLTRFLNNIMEDKKKIIILDPSSEFIWKRIFKYWVGDICSFADVIILPCCLESGISSLELILDPRSDNIGIVDRTGR